MLTFSSKGQISWVYYISSMTQGSLPLVYEKSVHPGQGNYVKCLASNLNLTYKVPQNRTHSAVKLTHQLPAGTTPELKHLSSGIKTSFFFFFLINCQYFLQIWQLIFLKFFFMGKKPPTNYSSDLKKHKILLGLHHLGILAINWHILLQQHLKNNFSSLIDFMT